jgi:hypothetical protein
LILSVELVLELLVGLVGLVGIIEELLEGLALIEGLFADTVPLGITVFTPFPLVLVRSSSIVLEQLQHDPGLPQLKIPLYFSPWSNRDIVLIMNRLIVAGSIVFILSILIL